MMLSAKKTPEEGWALKALPFGPFLVLAAFFYLFFGPPLIRWYFSLLW
jgi:prepilin signal peptidase PulO-like enzyme (type II secretory pathway)